MKYLTYLLFFVLIPCLIGQAQEYVKVEGVVKQEDGKPLADAYVKALDYWAVTNHDGSYTISVDKHTSYLEYSHINYQTQVVPIDVLDGKNQYRSIILFPQIAALTEVVVYANTTSTTESIDQLKNHHKRIAGGTSIVELKPATQRMETVKDALKYESGVIIQEFFGANDQPRISIRGSGIQSNPQRRGVYLMQDGIGINFADGSFISSVLDPAITQSIEVYKGANALHYGSATLGGAINFNTRTGKHKQGIEVKFEIGSFGYVQGNVLLGGKRDYLDGFLSVSSSKQNGFRDHNHNQKLNIASNVGYRFSKAIDTRFYVNYSFIDFDIPGPLTYQMLLEDPSGINSGIDLPYYMGPNVKRDKPKREAEVARISNRTAFSLTDRASLQLSLYYQYVKDRFAFPIVLSTQLSSGNDIGAKFELTQRLDKGKLMLGTVWNQGVTQRTGRINKDGLDSFAFSKDRLKASNTTFYFEYEHLFSDRFSLIGNLQYAFHQRNSQDLFPDPTLRPWYSHSSGKYRYFESKKQAFEQDYKGLNPRIGFVYQMRKDSSMQLFGNISRSSEPPTFDELTGTKVSDNINTSPKEFFAIKLENQTATTAELGSRYAGSRLSWNISIYRSWIKNELLEVKDFVLGVKKTMNYPRTIHQGIELGFEVTVFENLLPIEDKLSLKGMYTYSDFYFDAGEYTGNHLAGVPTHYLTGELTYQVNGKFFVAYNVESQPQKSYIDHSNTMTQRPFTVFGLRVGYENWKGFSIFAEVKNLFDKYYAASYIISDQIILPPIPFPNFTKDNMAFFMPGQTRAVYAGITYKFH